MVVMVVVVCINDYGGGPPQGPHSTCRCVRMILSPCQALEVSVCIHTSILLLRALRIAATQVLNLLRPPLPSLRPWMCSSHQTLYAFSAPKLCIHQELRQSNGTCMMVCCSRLSACGSHVLPMAWCKLSVLLRVKESTGVALIRLLY